MKISIYVGANSFALGDLSRPHTLLFVKIQGSYYSPYPKRCALPGTCHPLDEPFKTWDQETEKQYRQRGFVRLTIKAFRGTLGGSLKM
jgi:hypothetical protein